MNAEGILEKYARSLVICALILSLLILTACGGGSSSSSMSGGQNPQPNSAVLQVNIGDGPADQVVALSMSIGSMSLMNSAGNSVVVFSSPVQVEMMHLMGTMQPISLMNVPQGTYTKATLSIASAIVTYINPSTGQLVQKTISGPMNTTVDFSPAATVSSAPMVLNLDMNVAASVSIDAMGNVSMNPTMAGVMNQSVSGPGHDPEDGGMDHMTGAVSSISGSSFALSMMQSSQPLTVMTDSNTQFENMSGMGMMSKDMLVMVDAGMQPDGSLLAHKVESVMPSSGGAMAEGLVTALSGNPATQLTLVAHDGVGTGMIPSVLAGTITVNVSSGASFDIDSDNVDMSNLPFTLVFDGGSIVKGQRVEAVSGSGMMSGGGMGGGMMGGTITASEIQLEQQGLSGTVSGYSSTGSQATFTLTVAADSALATLTGKTSLTVFQQPGTTLRGLSGVTDGATVHVRGLLFLDAGTYKLVATRIMAP